jgi:ABC-type branched-subunit amino acid transport system ATPase component
VSIPLLKVEGLEVRYGDRIGVADVSLEVPRGSIVALLGSNGAGKTSTLNGPSVWLMHAVLRVAAYERHRHVSVE